MQNEKKYFLSTDSMLDADSADFVVPQNAWVNMENARTGTTDAGVIGTVESIGSTELIAGSSCVKYRLVARQMGDAEFSYIDCTGTPVDSVIVPNNTFIVVTALSGSVILIDGQGNISLESSIYIAIGMADDVENKRFVTLYYDTSAGGIHKIECCYTDTNTVYTVLQSTNVTGGLNFTEEPIHSAKITGNILSWVDGTNNEPRKINIESGMAAYDQGFQTDANPYSFPLNFSEITLIKRPPIYTPNIQKEYNDAFKNNFIANESFEFAFQYVYYDNETSVTSAYSQGSRLNYESDNFNYIAVTMDFAEQIPSTVKVINLIVRISDGKQTGGNNAFIVKNWDKGTPTESIEIANHNNGIATLAYNFYNNTTGEFLAEDDTLRQFDNVPIYSRSHEVARDRYFLGNNILGYDAPKETSLSISFEVTETGQTTLRSTLFYADFRQTLLVGGGVTTYLFYRAYYVYATLTISGVTRLGYYEITPSVVTSSGLIPTLVNAPPSIVQPTDLLYRGASISQSAESVKQQLRWREAQVFAFVTNFISGSPTTTGINRTQFTLISGANFGKYNIFPQLSTYNLGIVFYDYAMRRCSVVPYTQSDRELIYLYENISINGESPNRINFNTQIAISFWAIGDLIEISGGTAIDGTYEISSIGSTFIEVNGTLTTTNPQSGTIKIYRLVEGAIITPARDFSQSTAITNVIWDLSQQRTLEEIPDWAYYYSVVRTLNLTKRFFVQGYTRDLKYAERDSNGVYTFNSVRYDATRTVGLAINVESLQSNGLGYIYTDGDQAILTFYNRNYQLPIIAQEGNYVVVKPIDIGTISSNSDYTIIYEFYTPYQKSTQEPYYEIGEIYKINNPKTSNREYSVLSDSIKADSYLTTRLTPTTYKVNVMSPNDRFWQRWDSDAGKINFITKLGRAENITQILWSDTIVSGTKINGSSTFRIGNNAYVPNNSGAISKLILTSKVQEQGTVMLSICTNETNSMYLGETQITDSTGKVQFFGANSSQVISTINALKGSFGTINPEAVTEFRGSVFYPDANRGVWVQYSSNGLFPISNYKMTRFWKLFFQRYLSAEGQQYMSSNNIRPYLFSTVDASHLELLISIPEIYDTPPKGYLVDYPNEVYPFDIYDGKGKSIVFCLENTGVQPHWQGSYSFNPEQFMSLQNKLYSVKDGVLYQHNMTDSFNNFYDTQYTSKIMVISNQLPQRPKVYNNVSVEANMKPIFVYFYNDYPYLQTSDLEDVDFRDLEGVYYATLYRNKIIDNGSGTLQTTALLTGEKMRNVAMKIMLEFDVTEAPLELKFLNIGYDISKGHTT